MSQFKIIDPYNGWEAHKYQEEVMECDSRFMTIFSGRRGGKTEGAANKYYDKILEDIENGWGLPFIKPKSKNMKKITNYRATYWCVAPFYNLTRYQMQALSKVIPAEHIMEVNLSKNYILLKGYIAIFFVTANNPNAIVGASVRGMWIDESAKLKPEVWNGKLRQCMLDTQGWAIFTTTSEGKNWFYWDVLCQGQFIDIGGDYDDFKGRSDYANFTWSSLDNDKVPGQREEILERMKEMPKKDIDREIYSRVDIFEGQVYDNFSTTRNIVSQVFIDDLIKDNKIKNYYICKDWGFRNWGVSLLLAETYDGYWYVVDEMYKKEISDYSDSPTEENWYELDLIWYLKYKVKLVIADSNNPDAISKYRKRKIKNMKEADKDVSAGIKAVRSFIHFPEDDENYIPKLRINKNCKQLLRELNSYKWKDNGLEDVVKKDDHGCDALRYGIFTLNKTSIPKITNITKDKLPKFLR